MELGSTPRQDGTLGTHVGRVTRISGRSCWYVVDAGWERGPARLPADMPVQAGTTAGLAVGAAVAVYASRAGSYVLARY